MKYKNHEIKVVKSDLGFDDERYNKVYYIYKNNSHIDVAYDLWEAKDMIDKINKGSDRR